MEYADNGDLFQKISKHKKQGVYIDEKEIWNIAVQMIKGIDVLHEKKILHRDLKSANVFLCKDGTVKIGDMNVSKIAKRGLLYTQTGTPYYASPEVWNDKPYDSKSDIWSAGCIIYEMAALKPPFRAENMDGLYKKITNGSFNKLPSHYSVDLENLVRMMLKVKPSHRPSTSKLLTHPLLLKRLEKGMIYESTENLTMEMLKTIKMPKNLHYLTDRLPQANYNPIASKEITKDEGLHKRTMPELGSLSKSSRPGYEKSIPQDSVNEGNSKWNPDSLPIIKKVPGAGGKYKQEEIFQKEDSQIQAQLEMYDELLKNQKNSRKKTREDPMSIKKKIEMIIGKGPAAVQVSRSINGSNSRLMLINGYGIGKSPSSKRSKPGMPPINYENSRSKNPRKKAPYRLPELK